MLEYTIAFIVRGHEVLLINRNNSPMQGVWHGVGGKIEDGESPEFCIEREIFEETGIRLAPGKIRFAGIVTWNGKDGQYNKGMYAYVAEVGEDFMYPTPIEVEEGILAWKPLDWVCNEDNYGVGRHVMRFLPPMLFESQCYEHRCRFKNRELVAYELTPLEGQRRDEADFAAYNAKLERID